MIKRATMTALLALVAGCGGGGTTPAVTGETAAPPAAVTPTPSPATPTPAPTTPTPPPATVSYTSFDDIYSTRFGSSGVSVQSACAGFATATATPSTPSAFGRGLVFRYVQTPNVWSISGEVGVGFDGRDSDPFAAMFVDPSAAGAVEFAYSKSIGTAPGRFTIRKPAPGDVGLNYTRLASVWATVSGTARLYQCIPGTPTVASEIAAMAAGNYARTAVQATAYTGGRAYILTRSSAIVGIDVASRRITLTLPLTGTPADGVGGTVDLGSVTANLTLDPATGAFAGDLTGTGRTISGTVSGQLFGPQGNEIALVFGLTAGAGATTPAFTASGAIFAAR